MLSDSGLAALRTAATMNHLFPGLSTRISTGGSGGGRSGGRIRTVVAWAGSPASDEFERVQDDALCLVRPCPFRQRTADAWRRAELGWALGFLDLDADPVVTLHPGPGGEVWPSGVVRVPLLDRLVYTFGTTAELDEETALLLTELDALPEVEATGTRVDDDTAVTVVFAEVRLDPKHPAEPIVVEQLESLLARLMVGQLLDGLPGHRARH